MKALFIALLLLTAPQAHARQLLFTCSINVDVGGAQFSNQGSVGYSGGTGFETPGGIISIPETDKLKAEVTVVRDTQMEQGFFYRLHLIDLTNGKETNAPFFDSIVVRPRPEGSTSINCIIEA